MTAFDEMCLDESGPRRPYRDYEHWYSQQDRGWLSRKARDAEQVFRRTGITFAVYGEETPPSG